MVSLAVAPSKTPMIFKPLKEKYQHWELAFIEKHYPFQSGTMTDVSLLPIKLLVKRLDRYYSENVNVSQNANHSVSVFNNSIVSATIVLERISKAYRKDLLAVEERYEFELREVVTYIFFTDEQGIVVDVEKYVKRLKDVLTYLIGFFETHRKTEGTIAYANCKRFYTHLSTIHTFVNNLLNVFLNRPIK